MDQIIDTLSKAEYWLNEFLNPKMRSYGHDEVQEVIDNLTILIDQFQDAKKWVEQLTGGTHDSEGEPVAHLVEDPASGEGLTNSPASEENNLGEGEMVTEEEWAKKYDKSCPVIDQYEDGVGIDLTQPGAKEEFQEALKQVDEETNDELYECETCSDSHFYPGYVVVLEKH